MVRKDLREAWQRFVDDSYTCEDLALILDSVRDDECLEEYHGAFDSVWKMSLSDLPLVSEDRKEIYRREAAQLLAEYQRKQQMKMKRISPQNNTIDRFRKIFYWAAAAAVLLFGLLIPATFYFLKPEQKQAVVVQYLETVTQRGEIKSVVFPDQTKVTLNSESRLIYPDHFNGDERSVELHGEALFEVSSDPERPFTVKTGNMNITVLGTVFGVKEYTDDLLTTVSVASGKVEVGLAGGKVLLEKNHQVRMDKTTENFEKLTIDAEKYLSWTDGTLYFQRTPIREAVNMINRRYPQMEIVLADGEYTNLISGRHDNASLEAVLTSIVYSTRIKYKQEGKTIILYQ